MLIPLIDSLAIGCTARRSDRSANRPARPSSTNAARGAADA